MLPHKELPVMMEHRVLEVLKVLQVLRVSQENMPHKVLKVKLVHIYKYGAL